MDAELCHYTLTEAAALLRRRATSSVELMQGSTEVERADEVSLCQVGHAYEQAMEWHTRRPPLS